ncbi:MAG: class I SAM-dependent methyltransferase [Nannocystaceae bacterium]
MTGLLALERCPLCERAAADASPIYAPRGGVAIDRCRGCGLAFASHYAASAVIGADYAARADRDVDPEPGAAASGERPGVARRRVQLRLYDRLSRGRIGRPHPGSRALDVGCNTGLLLDALRELGYVTAGIERSPAYHLAAAAGHAIVQADIEEADERGDRYDLITITHVLEHLARPVAALRWIGRHLADAGLAVIEVPNFADLARPLWGAAYRPLELGDHLIFFERETLQAAIERAGLRVLELWSAPQTATMVFPSALTAVDLGLGLARRLRGRGAPTIERDVAGPSGLDRSARVRGGGRLSAIVEPMVAALGSLDALLERGFGAECRWGANLVAIVGR